MIKKTEMIFYIDKTAYCILFLFFSLYAMFGSNFSEINVQLYHLDFPVFISEFALFTLLFLAMWKWRLIGNVIDFKKKLMWVFFAGFILVKTAYGYQYHGPLALRNAAMFYYVSYAILASYFYNPKLLTKTTRVLMAIFLLAIPCSPYFRTYFLYTYIVILFIILAQTKHNWLRIIMIGWMFSFFPLKQLLSIGRGAFLSNIFATTFMIICLTTLNDIRSIKRWLVLLIFGIAVFLAAFLCMDKVSKKRLIAIFDLKQWKLQYGEEMQLADNRLKNYKPAPFAVRIYEPNTPDNIGIGGHSRRQVQENREKQVGIAGETISHGDRSLINLPVSRSKIEPAAEKSSPKMVEISIDSIYVADAVLKAEAAGVGQKRDSLFQLMTNSLFEKILPNEIEKPNSIVSSQLQQSTIKNQEDQSRSSLVWRSFLWQDIFDEWIQKMNENRALLIWGLDFGQPIRSKRQEAILYYLPQITGWLEPHNFLIHIIYRTGLIGLCMFGCAMWLVWRKTTLAIRYRLWRGILLLSVLIYWVSFSMTMVIMELPHYAVPFWSLLGLTFAYIRDATNKSIIVAQENWTKN